MTNTRTANFPDLKPTLARDGVWTPWAQVLCVECDYQYALKNPRWQTSHPGRWQALCKLDRTALITQSEGDELGTCDGCDCPCWVRFDVAMCQRVGHAYGDISWEMDDVRGTFSLDQTGGMCCAATFTITNDDDVAMAVVVLTAMDGFFYVGTYKRTDEPMDEPIEWNEALAQWESASYFMDDGEYKSGAELDAMVTECANKVIEFVRSVS